VAVLVGCVAPAATVPPPAAPSPAAPPPALVAPTFREPVLLGSIGPLGGEPSIATSGADRVFAFVAGHLWRSVDGGATFAASNVTFPEGAGDADLATDAKGDVFFVGLDQGDTRIPFRVSHDDGVTWSGVVDLTPDHKGADRPWMDALPNGTVYVTWRAGPDLVLRRSFDAGATWSGPLVVGNDDLQGPLVHDPASGALYTILYERGVQIVRSEDQGSTWTVRGVWKDDRPLAAQYARPLDEFPVLAVDDAGALYAAWATDAAGLAKQAGVPQVFLAVSTDHGETWSKPAAISPADRSSIFPWTSAGKAGRVVVSWYENEHGVPSEDAPDAWDVAVAESVDASSPGAKWALGQANRAPVHVGSLCSNGGACSARVCPQALACVGDDRSRADFFENAIRPGGQPVLVWIADGDTAPVNTGVKVYAGGATSGTPLS
jgi:hypothetical protein